MREILFKARHIHVFPGNTHLDDAWVYGYLSDENYIYCPELDGEVLIDPETVCQYTGLTDKNLLQKVFEYDIIDANGRKVGNYYENKDLLEDGTNLLIGRMGTKEWICTEQEAIKRGCQYAE